MALRRRSWRTGRLRGTNSRRSGGPCPPDRSPRTCQQGPAAFDRRCEMEQPRVLGIGLAGGAGKRLAPLSADRSKPAVPFGGLYRLIDFALSNLVTAVCRRICVLTQYKSHSL